MSFSRRGREYAQRLVESASYREWLCERIRDKALDSSIERMLWAYAYGKPKVYLEVSQTETDLSELSTEELQERARRVSQALVELGEEGRNQPAEPELPLH